LLRFGSRAGIWIGLTVALVLVASGVGFVTSTGPGEAVFAVQGVRGQTQGANALAVSLQNSVPRRSWVGGMHLRANGTSSVGLVQATNLTIGDPREETVLVDDGFMNGSSSSFQILSPNHLVEGGLAFAILGFNSPQGAKQFYLHWIKRGNRLHNLDGIPGGVSREIKVNLSCVNRFSSCDNAVADFTIKDLILIGTASCGFTNGCVSLSDQVARSIYGSI
jgi:hypothetical protein